MNNRKKYWQRGDFYLVVLYFAFFMMILVGAFGFPRLVKLFPLLVGSLGLFLLTMDILQILIPRFGIQFSSIKGGELFATDKEQEKSIDREEQGESSQPRRILYTLGWFAGAFVIFFTLGYFLFSVLFLFLFLMFYARFNLRRSLGITAGFSLCFWLAFSLFLKLNLTAGSALF